MAKTRDEVQQHLTTDGKVQARAVGEFVEVALPNGRAYVKPEKNGEREGYFVRVDDVWCADDGDFDELIKMLQSLRRGRSTDRGAVGP